MIFRRLLHVVI